MTKSGLLFVVFIMCVGWVYGYDTTAKADEALTTIMDVMDESNISLNEWTLTARGNKGFVSDRLGYKMIVKTLQKELPEFRWETIEEEDDVMRSVASHRLGDLTETITLLSHLKGDSFETVLFYEVSGKRWDSNALRVFQSRTSDLFSDAPQIFSCASGMWNAKMLNVDLSERATELMHKFDASFVEQLEEETFVSLSAYTTLWNESLLTNNKKMNLQIALRNEEKNNQITVTIGTPILTIEY